MCLYLRLRGRTYQFRRPIPEHLQPFFLKPGKTKPPVEFRYSLRVKDKAVAKRRRTEEMARTDALLDEAEAAYAAARGIAPAAPLEMTDAEREEAAFRAREAAEHKERWAARVEERNAFRRRMGLHSAELSQMERVARDLIRAEQEKSARLAETQSVEAQQTERPSPRKGGRVSLNGLFLNYAKTVSASTAVSWKSVIRHYVAFAKSDDARDITKAAVESWRDHLLQEVTERGSVRSPRTIKDGYVAALKAVLGFGVDTGLLADNAASGVKVRYRKPAKIRERDFTKAEAATILAATTEDFSNNISEPYRRARRWVPWLCAYTGARVNEIGQLRRQDIQKVEGVWMIEITPEAGSVKTNEARVVPVHQHLIEQGLLSAVASLPEGPMFYDPSRQRKKDAQTRHRKKVGEHG